MSPLDAPTAGNRHTYRHAQTLTPWELFATGNRRGVDQESSKSPRAAPSCARRYNTLWKEHNVPRLQPTGWDAARSCWNTADRDATDDPIIALCRLVRQVTNGKGSFTKLEAEYADIPVQKTSPSITLSAMFTIALCIENITLDRLERLSEAH